MFGLCPCRIWYSLVQYGGAPKLNMLKSRNTAKSYSISLVREYSTDPRSRGLMVKAESDWRDSQPQVAMHS